ncbi:MAG: universal stress protein [Anaerolineae bacterium]|jgi:nucleotide-binding universal stress UspA family protein|nr:universal stress protein [Anaerolineae bacterium]MCZ7552466.1 universal stress protein [Anaerolineales bacterium]
MVQRILVPLDGSKRAESALPLACSLASKDDAQMILLHILEYPSEVYSGLAYSGFAPRPLADPAVNEKTQEKKEAIYNKVKGYLEETAARIGSSALSVSIEIHEGPVVETILSSIEKLGVNLIVMSSTGEDRSPWMLGAIADRILREAYAPVVLLREGPGGLGPDCPALQGESLPKLIES